MARIREEITMAKTKNTFLLLLTAFIWGVAFVAQSEGMDFVGPFTFNAVRSVIGGLVLIPCICFLNRNKEKETGAKSVGTRKDLLVGGISCGVVLAAASSFQQIGIQYTTPGKAGFMTALYIVIVPIMGIFLKKKPRMLIWGSVVLAVAGLYFLCITGKDKAEFSTGEIDLLLCAVLFSVHILVIDHFSTKTDGVKMACIQFLTAGILCGIPMLLFEHPSISAVWNAKLPILYAGALSCGAGYTLQIIGQRDYDPTIASLLLSLESVFSVLAGWLLMGETLNGRELFGCVLVFAAVTLAQLPGKKAVQ